MGGTTVVSRQNSVTLLQQTEEWAGRDVNTLYAYAVF